MDSFGMDNIINDPKLLELIARIEDETEYCPICDNVFVNDDSYWIKTCAYCGHEWEDPEGFSMT